MSYSIAFKGVMMKKIFLVLFLSCSLVTAQNAFMNGINNNKKECKDMLGDTYSEFKAREIGSDGFEVSRKKYVDYDYDYAISYEKYVWSWKDVTYLHFNTDEVSFDLRGDKDFLNVESKDETSGEITNKKVRGITIFFASANEAKAASQWLVDKVKNCGGKVLLGN
jgi:hypothetical protein